MKVSRWMQIAIMAAVWCHRTMAVGIPHFNIDESFKSADVIVIADVKGVRDLGTAQPVQYGSRLLPATVYSADLSVRRTLKGGPVPEEIRVTYPFPVVFVAFTPLRPGTRVVFLRRDKDEYHLADPYYSNFPATREPPGEDAHSEDSSELVLSNMLAVLASPRASTSEKREILRVDYALPSNEETIAALRKGLSVSTDPDLSERIQGELIRFGDLSQLPEAVNLLSNNSATENGKQWLLYIIGEYLKDPRAVSGIDPLLSSPDNSVREAGVEALWHIGASAAVPSLVQKLEDPDEMARFYAVRGLSDIANEYGWGGPGEAEFHEHAQKYLTHWQEWAKNRAK